MNLVIWLVVGALAGLLVSLLTRGDDDPRIIVHVMAGVAGALAGGWVLSPLFGGSTNDAADFSSVGLLTAFAGAAVALAVTHLVRREIAD